jgi:hypothetical protein
MASPKSVELKLGTKEPSMEEAKRCELKLPVEIKRTARIHCGGCVPTRAIDSRNPVKEEKVPTPIRMSAHIQGIKKKDYKEVSPKPKDYRGSVDGRLSYQSSYGFASRQIDRRSQGTLLPSSGEPKVSNPWNNVQHKDSI